MSVFFIVVIAITLLYHNDIATYVIDNFIYHKTIITYDSNDYKRDYNFNYVQMTNNFYPKNENDIYNIFYTILNNGWEEFSFFCDSSYETCINDINKITSNNNVLSSINNFVHPYNSFSQIYIETNNFGKITVEVSYMYSKDEIEIINEKVDNIIKEKINNKMGTPEKIRAIHDYIISTTTYDSKLAETIKNNTTEFHNNEHRSHIAYGPLIEGYGICGGYSDAMAIFLNRLDIENYKISNISHVWNYVNVDGKWYHLDLTWDDPVLTNDEEVLLHNFFLITSDELEEINTGEHYYEKKVYLQ